jgi:hypothetical protein
MALFDGLHYSRREMRVSDNLLNEWAYAIVSNMTNEEKQGRGDNITGRAIGKLMVIFPADSDVYAILLRAAESLRRVCELHGATAAVDVAVRTYAKTEAMAKILERTIDKAARRIPSDRTAAIMVAGIEVMLAHNLDTSKDTLLTAMCGNMKVIPRGGPLNRADTGPHPTI